VSVLYLGKGQAHVDVVVEHLQHELLAIGGRIHRCNAIEIILTIKHLGHSRTFYIQYTSELVPIFKLGIGNPDSNAVRQSLVVAALHIRHRQKVRMN